MTPEFSVVPGADVQRVLDGREPEVLALVEATYRQHAAGGSVNPPSYFLRFPDRPSARIIALPASLGGADAVDGLKWISSFPDNVATGLPRASAVLVLNDPATGYPYACLEGSMISASRTAAMAVAAAGRLGGERRPSRVGFVGVGLIARYVHTFLARTGWSFEEVGLHDVTPDSVEGFRRYLDRSGAGAAVVVHESAEDLIAGSDLVVLATVAGSPYIGLGPWFDQHPLVLNLSLRDLAPEVLLASTNILDDVEHCLKADTSPHLAEQLTGARDFVDGTLADVIDGRLVPTPERTVVFSPFGLGVLDLAVGRWVHDELARAGRLQPVDGFFHDLRRYG